MHNLRGKILKNVKNGDLPEFRLGDTFDRLPAPSLLLVRWGKVEEEAFGERFTNQSNETKHKDKRQL